MGMRDCDRERVLAGGRGEAQSYGSTITCNATTRILGFHLSGYFISYQFSSACFASCDLCGIFCEV